MQVGQFFHSYCRHYCCLPPYVTCDDFVLCARLCPINIDAAEGSVGEQQRIVAQMRTAWLATRVLVSCDAGFCRDDLLAKCEDAKKKTKAGMLPRRSRNVCGLTAPLVLRNQAYGNSDWQRSIVELSSA